MGPLDYVRAASVVRPTTHDWPFIRAKPPHPHLAWLGLVTRLLLGLRDLEIYRGQPQGADMGADSCAWWATAARPGQAPYV